MAMKEISDATTLLRRKRYSLPEIVMRKCNLRSFRKRQPAAASVDEEKNRFFSKSASTVETTIDQYVSIASDPATNHAAQGSECDVKDQCCQTESVSTRHHKQKSVSRSFKCKKWRKSKSRLSRSSSTLDDSNRTSNDDSSQRPASDANANNNNNNGNNADEAKKSIRKPLVSCLNHDNRNKLATFRRLMSAPLSRSRLFSKDSFDSARNFEAEIDGRILTAGKDDNAEQQSKQVDQLVIIERSTDNWPDDSAADRVVPIISVDSEPAGNSKNSTIENEPDRSSSDGGSVAEERPNDETKPGIDDCRLNENYESAVRSIIRVRSELNSDVTTGSAKKSAESANGQSSREPFKSYSINSESNIDISISNRDRNGGENLLNYREKSTVDIRTDGENGRKEIDTPSVMFNSENTIVCEGGRDCLVTRKESRNFSLSRIDERNRSEDGSTRESADNGSVVAQRQSSEVHGKVPDSELTEGAELSPPVSVRNCDSVKLFSSDGEPDPATRSLMRPLNRPSLTYGKYYSDLPSSRAMDDLPHGKVLFNDKRYDILSTNLLPTERMVLAADGVAVSKLNRSTMEMLSDSDVSVADSLEELQLKEVTSEANCRRPNAEIKCNNNKFDDKPVRGHVSLDETERDAARIKRQSDKSIAYFIPLTTEDEMSGQEFVAVAAPKRKESIKSSKRYNENLSKDKSGKTKHISSINENAPDGTPTVCSFDEKSEQLPHIVDYPLKLFDTNLNNDKRDNDNNYNNNNINNNNNNNNNNNSNNNNNNNSVSEIVLTEFEAQKSKSSSCMDSSFRPINITECDNNEDIDEQIKRVLLGDALKVEEQAKSHATDDFSIDTPICDENVTGGIGEEIERQLSHRPKAEKQLQRHDFSSTASVDNNNNNIDDNDIDEKIKRVLLGGLQVQNRAEIGTNSTTSSSKSIQTDKSTSEQQLLMGRSRLMKARNADSTIEYYEFINLIASKTNSDFRPTNFFHCPDEVVDDDKTVVVANEQKPKKPGHRAKDTNHSFVRSTEQVIADIIKSSNRKQLSTYQAMIKKLNTTGRYRSESVIGVHPPPRQMLPQPIGRYGIPSGHKNVASSRRLTHKNKPKASSGRKSTSRKYHQTFPSIPEELTSNTSNNNSNNVNNNSSTGIHEKHPEVVVVCEGASAAKDEKAIMAAKSERDDTDQWSITNSKTMETDEAADKPTSPNERAKRSSPIRMHKGRDELLSRDDDENDRQITLSRGWINFYVLKDNSEDAGTLSVDRDKSWSTIADNETPLPDNLEEVKRYTLHIEASPQSPEPNIGRSPTFPNIEVKKHKNDFFPRMYQTEIACNNVQIATTGGNDASGDAATKLSNIFPKLRYSRGYEETSGKTNDHSVFHDRCKTNKFLPSRPVHCRMEAARSTCVPEKNPMKISDNKRPKSHQSTSSNSSTSSTEGNRWSLLIKGADNKSHSPEVKMRLSYKNAVEKSSASSKHVWTVSVRKEKAELEENKFWDGSENNDDSWKEEVNVPVNWEQRELAKTVQEQGNKRSMTLSKQNSRLYSSITADRCPDTDQIMKHIRTRWQDDLQLNNQKSELSIKGSSAGTDKRPRIPTLSERDLIRMKLL